MALAGEASGKKSIEPLVFWPSLLAILSLCIPSMIWPQAGGEIVNAVRGWISSNFGWLYMVAALAAVGMLLWLATGRYAQVKLGGPDDEPEFSNLTWIAMLYCAGIGSNLVYWSIIEPIYYLQEPPFGLSSNSPMAAEWAAAYGPFHWGVSAWALYCVATVPIAYSYHVRKEKKLSFSMASQSVLGRHADGLPGKAMDVAVMLGIIGGVATSLGLGTPMIAACVGRIFDVPQSFVLNVIILVIWTILFGTSVFLGLQKGIARLSNINLYLALALAAFVLVVGPTSFILNLFTNSMSLGLDNFFRMSLWTDPIANQGFPQTWTIFYWAWWVAYAPMMGLFVARISKGRTIRQLIVAMCFWGVMGCWLFFAVFGGYAINIELVGAQSMTTLMAEQGPAEAIASVLASLPLSTLMLPLVVVLLMVFLATTLDSSAYALASVSTKELHGDEEPERWNRVLWAVVLGLMAVMMFAIGGLEVIQAASIVLAFPLLSALVVLMWAFLKNLKEDYGEALAPKLPQPVEYLEGGLRAPSGSDLISSRDRFQT